MNKREEEEENERKKIVSNESVTIPLKTSDEWKN